MARTSYFIMYYPEQHSALIFKMLAHWNNGPQTRYAPCVTCTHHPNSEKNSLRSFTILMCA